MVSVSTVRFKIPKASTHEIVRQELLNTTLGSNKKLIYIHAGAGYGKTTLLSQIARNNERTVWLTLDGESDIFTFMTTIGEAIRQTFPTYDMIVSEYLPYEGQNNFITILANALISSFEKQNADFTLILEDLHTVEDLQIKGLIACLIKYLPDNIRLCLSSREAPWQDLNPLRLKEYWLELSQQELAFTQDETRLFLGFSDEKIHDLTEGWPLAILSIKLLLENGISVSDIPSLGPEALYPYLFYECLNNLPPDYPDFLKASACFEELNPELLDAVLQQKNSKLILDRLVARNIFTIRTRGGQYRHHPLLREYLLLDVPSSEKVRLLNDAVLYHFEQEDYAQAARYAMQTKNMDMLQQILLAAYKDYIKNGRFTELRAWIQALEEAPGPLSRELLVAKGSFLSSIGNFTAAKTCLDAAIPLLEEEDQELYIEAMVHKARVLRNYISFEVSNTLLDELIAKLDHLATELSYSVVIEKLFNLCYNSQINEAYALIHTMIETCARAGNVKVKAWFERYLSAIHYFAGRMKDTVYYYEKSLELPANEQEYLALHSIEIFAAKAYQMLGEREKAVAMITLEVQRLRSTGRYEELWLGYLFAAEISYQNAFIDRMTGGTQTFETTMKYFTLADEYAPLYRQTEFQLKWAKMQRLVYSLIFTSGSKNDILDEIYQNLAQVGDYFQTIALARLFGYFSAESDFPNAVKCAKQCIAIGERSNLMLPPTLAYGILSRAAIAMNDHAQGVYLTGRYLRLCYENGVYEYFRIRKAYDPILEFANDNGIEPEITKQIMAFAGFKTKKIYIETFGSFSIFPYADRQKPLKMRTKKERELLAFLLDGNTKGVTKEQIYQAIWSESESDDIKKLIGVNIAQIKKDLATFDVENPIINSHSHYSLCRDEILTDTDLYEVAMKEFEQQQSRAAAEKLLALYKGEYLADFEALWAVLNRIRYREAYEVALQFISKVGNKNTS